MTGRSNKFNKMGTVVVAVAVAVSVLAAVGGACPCDIDVEEYVFPFEARFVTAINTMPYHYVSAAVSAALGGIEPEWDESNSTYYVRFTGDSSNAGAKYTASPSDLALQLPIFLNCTVYLFNAETRNYLQWRKEGSNEYFLTEQEWSSGIGAAPFRFRRANDVPWYLQPGLCSTTAAPRFRCNDYYLVSDPDPSSGYVDAGLVAYGEEGATYIKAAPAGSVGDLPLFLKFPAPVYPDQPAILDPLTHHLS